MAEENGLAHFGDIPLEIEAVAPGPALRVSDLMNLRPGSLITTSRAAGETLDLFAGEASIGAGELAESGGRAIVRMVAFGGKS